MVESYLFEKDKTFLNQTTYNGVYCNGGLVFFKGKKSVQEIKYWLAEFQQTLEKVEGNKNLQLTT